MIKIKLSWLIWSTDIIPCFKFTYRRSTEDFSNYVLNKECSNNSLRTPICSSYSLQILGFCKEFLPFDFFLIFFFRIVALIVCHCLFSFIYCPCIIRGMFVVLQMF